jgi:Plasmid pRiA4b ORF-3-like protein
VLVPEATTLLRLHEVLQAAFGWWDSHLHELEIDGVRYGTDDGESWGHRLVVKKIVTAAPGTTYPACIAGRRACPPEDCGGVWGNADFVTAISDPTHSEHDSMLEWWAAPTTQGSSTPATSPIAFSSAGPSSNRSSKERQADPGRLSAGSTLEQFVHLTTHGLNSAAISRFLWRRWDSNPRPPACKAGALAN